MNKINLCRLLGIMAIVVGFVAFDSQQASGAMTLSTQLRGKMVNGEAWYITYGKNSAAFFATVEGATPDTELKVTYRRGVQVEEVTRMRTDLKGNARVTVYSNIPPMQVNDRLEVWQGKESIASGVLALVVSDPK